MRQTNSIINKFWNSKLVTNSHKLHSFGDVETMTSKETKEQLIKELIDELNPFDDPSIKKKLYTISNEIYEYWTNYKDANYNSTTKTFELE